MARTTTNDGGAAVVVFVALVTGWLFLTGRLQAVFEVIQSGSDVVILPRNFAGFGGGGGGGSTGGGTVPTVPPPGMGGGGGGSAGSYYAEIPAGPGAPMGTMPVKVLVRPGLSYCAVMLYVVATRQGYGPEQAEALANRLCGM